MVVLNSRHAFLTDLLRVNAGGLIADRYKGKVANVFINTIAMKQIKSDQHVSLTAIQQGKWDAAFIKTKKKDTGFDLSETPFGQDSVDLYPFSLNHTYSNLFKGFVYYNYFPDLRIVYNVENFVDDAFAPELLRRYRLVQKVTGENTPSIETLKEKNNKVVSKTYREELPEAVTIVEQWLK